MRGMVSHLDDRPAAVAAAVVIAAAADLQGTRALGGTDQALALAVANDHLLAAQERRRPRIAGLGHLVFALPRVLGLVADVRRIGGGGERNFVRVLVGDRVIVELMPRDLTRARIVRRVGSRQ